MVNVEIAEVDLHYKRNKQYAERVRITTPTEAFEVLINHWDMNKIELVEQSKLLLLDCYDSHRD